MGHLGSLSRAPLKRNIGAYIWARYWTVFWECFGLWDFPMGAWYGPLTSLKGSEVWVPVLKVVCNGVIMGL